MLRPSLDVNIINEFCIDNAAILPEKDIGGLSWKIGFSLDLKLFVIRLLGLSSLTEQGSDRGDICQQYSESQLQNAPEGTGWGKFCWGYSPC